MPEEQGADALEELRRFGQAVGDEPVVWDTPPADLWARISGDVAPPQGAGAADRDASTTSHAPVVQLEPRRRRWAGWWIGAAAAIVLVTVAAASWLRRPDDATVLASADLELLGDAGSGTAELVDHNGSLQLRVVTDGVEAADGFTEIWLINTDVTELVSLGPMRSDGTYELPAGLDPESFPIVDVSFEPFDGNPQHSGNSVLRGQLTF